MDSAMRRLDGWLNGTEMAPRAMGPPRDRACRQQRRSAMGACLTVGTSHASRWLTWSYGGQWQGTAVQDPFCRAYGILDARISAEGKGLIVHTAILQSIVLCMTCRGNPLGCLLYGRQETASCVGRPKYCCPKSAQGSSRQRVLHVAALSPMEALRAAPTLRWAPSLLLELALRSLRLCPHRVKRRSGQQHGRQSV